MDHLSWQWVYFTVQTELHGWNIQEANKIMFAVAIINRIKKQTVSYLEAFRFLVGMELWDLGKSNYINAL